MIKESKEVFVNFCYENLKLSNNGRIEQSVKVGFKEDVIKYNLKTRSMKLETNTQKILFILV